MKNVLFPLLGCLLSLSAQAQMDGPVQWKFSSKKIGDRTYEIRFTASIEPPWHIYAQDMNADAGFPTSIRFADNQAIELDGKTREEGRLVEKKIDNITLKYYREQVDFVQVVKLKSDTKTNVSGKIDFMPCTDSHCLSAAFRRFSIALE